MRILFLLMLSGRLHAQVLCGTANENSSVTLTAPSGNTFTSIQFASYGTPTGSCGAFATSSCHSANSVNVVSSALLGRNSATIQATNAVFGDPCVGTVKRLYIQAQYSATVPLTLLSFTAERVHGGKVLLQWQTAEETNTGYFMIERAGDGLTFSPAGSIVAGREYYSFLDRSAGEVYYRLKIVDIDETFTYSRIIRVSQQKYVSPVGVFPNPSNAQVSVFSDKSQEAIMSDANGRLIKRFRLVSGIQQIDTRNCRAGLYFIKTESGVLKFFKR